MPDTERFLCDAAPAVNQGRRACQEDTLAVDFTAGADLGFAVLADGMGGHAAGDVASKVVVTEVFSELKMQAGDPSATGENIGSLLRRATDGANDCLATYIRQFPETAGMGATLVAPVISGNQLYWISVGDSPLYLFRGQHLFRLNEEHSLGQQLQDRVDEGALSQELADLHPDRNCLTSALMGNRIPQVDCREVPVELRHDDIIVAASDGLQYLTDVQIARVIFENRFRPASEITDRLMQAVLDLQDPEQDNIALCTIRVSDPRARRQDPPVRVATRRIFLNLHGEKKQVIGRAQAQALL
ncbi:protein phosphatase 2C domain-containing protein [uncultured Roseobacter sp.]|uniref:PP2C family protein-serine/threonine phosphatase n=1 Tax=uncultured Roseobacter sp. TaxID=114847 RepID=UPI002603E0E7|nr:protein phosphatase 2C domain-containing protein [uncultured Roseobacter sp.]